MAHPKLFKACKADPNTKPIHLAINVPALQAGAESEGRWFPGFTPGCHVTGFQPGRRGGVFAGTESVMECGGKADAATPLSGGREAGELLWVIRAGESGVALRFPP